MDENLSKQILAMGFPSARIMLHALAKYYNKECFNDKIEEICHIQDVGCLNIKFYNKNENKEDFMLIFLKECKQDHNLTEQLDKLKIHLSDNEWKEVIKSLSTVILLARKIYTSIYDNNIELVKEIVGDNNIEKYNNLLVDILNTTLYLPDIEDRIGIFVDNN